MAQLYWFEWLKCRFFADFFAKTLLNSSCSDVAQINSIRVIDARFAHAFASAVCHNLISWGFSSRTTCTLPIASSHTCWRYPISICCTF